MSDVPPETQSRWNGGLTRPTPTWRCWGSPPNIGDRSGCRAGTATVCVGTYSTDEPLTLPP